MQALLSEHWHAVRWLRPRLRSGVQALHRRLRGRAWVLLHDPVSQRFHRVTPAVWRVLALLDGHRTLDEVWDQACAADPAGHGAAGNEAEAAAISQPELVQLLSSLYAHDLLQTQVSPDAAEVLAQTASRKRGPKADSENHEKVASIIKPYGEHWTTDENLMEICDELDRQNIPAPKTWARRGPHLEPRTTPLPVPCRQGYQRHELNAQKE